MSGHSTTLISTLLGNVKFTLVLPADSCPEHSCVEVAMLFPLALGLLQA
jgi:hypothetical protein